MEIHPLVTQLHFARSELERCLAGVSEEDAVKRVMPMNCISWIVGHMANQEQGFWVVVAQGKLLVPGLGELVGFGRPASTPPLAEMRAAWQTITRAADDFLCALTVERLTEYMTYQGQPVDEGIGTLLQRNTYHYWYHIGQAHAVREMLGHQDLPEYVGDMTNAAYRPETAIRPETAH